MRMLCIVGLATVLLASGCQTQQGESFVLAGYDFSQVSRVAVLQPTGDVYGTAVKNQIAGFFEQELMRKGYECIERSQIDRIMKEHEFQASGITSAEGAVQAGRILNVPVVMLVSVPKFDEKISVNAKMVRVEDGVILWSGDGYGRTGKGLNTLLGGALGAAAGAAVAGGDSRDRTVGAVIGGAAGAVAGNALSPEVEQQFKKIIRENVCKDLPARYASAAAMK